MGSMWWLLCGRGLHMYRTTRQPSCSWKLFTEDTLTLHVHWLQRLANVVIGSKAEPVSSFCAGGNRPGGACDCLQQGHRATQWPVEPLGPSCAAGRRRQCHSGSSGPRMLTYRGAAENACLSTQLAGKSDAPHRGISSGFSTAHAVLAPL